jgi:hypothetical protein
MGKARAFVVDRAANPEAGLVEDMCVNHCGGDVFVSEELLDSADVVARLEQMCSKTVAKSVTAGGFAQAGSADR